MDGRTVWSIGVAVIAAIMIVGGYGLILNRMKAHNQRIDGEAIRAIGLVTFLPVLLLASAGGFIQGDALSALMGAVGGYVLSRGNEKGS